MVEHMVYMEDRCAYRWQCSIGLVDIKHSSRGIEVIFRITRELRRNRYKPGHITIHINIYSVRVRVRVRAAHAATVDA